LAVLVVSEAVEVQREVVFRHLFEGDGPGALRDQRLMLFAPLKQRIDAIEEVLPVFARLLSRLSETDRMRPAKAKIMPPASQFVPEDETTIEAIGMRLIANDL
jgi:hypothetical protein